MQECRQTLDLVDSSIDGPLDNARFAALLSVKFCRYVKDIELVFDQSQLSACDKQIENIHNSRGVSQIKSKPILLDLVHLL